MKFKAKYSTQMNNNLEIRIKELFKNAFIYGFGSIAQSGLNFLLIPVMTIYLSQKEFGIYSLILMSGIIASSIFYLGITSALPRSYFDFDDQNKRNSIFSSGLFIIFIGAISQLFIGYFFQENISYFLFREIVETKSVFWCFFAGSIGVLNQYLLGFLRILRFAITSVIINISSLILSIGLIIFSLNLFPENKILVSFVALTLSNAITFIFLFSVIFSKYFIFKFDFDESRKLIAFGVASVFASIGYMFFEWSDRFIIERFLSLPDVGVYSAAVRIGSIINVLMIIPFAQIWSPMMIEYKNDDYVKDLFSKVTSYFMIIGIIFLVPGIIFSFEISTILIQFQETNFNEISTVASIFMISYFFYGLSNITTVGIIYERKAHMLPFVYIFFGFIKFYLGLLVVSKYGLVGLSFVALFISLFVPIAFYYISKFYFTFKIEIREIFKALLFILLLIVFKLTESFFQINLIEKILLIGFFYTLIIFNFLGKEEKNFLKKYLFK